MTRRPGRKSGWGAASTSPLSALEFRPGSHHLAVAGGKVACVFDVDAGNVPLQALSHPEDVRSIAWHPQGWVLATTCDDLKIRLWDVSTGMLALPPLEGHHVDGMVVEFNHRGDRLASKDWGDTSGDGTAAPAGNC